MAYIIFCFQQFLLTGNYLIISSLSKIHRDKYISVINTHYRLTWYLVQHSGIVLLIKLTGETYSYFFSSDGNFRKEIFQLRNFPHPLMGYDFSCTIILNIAEMRSEGAIVSLQT